MITCNLNGRLGNQMFQIATTIGTAIKNDVLYSIPKKTINMDQFKPYYNHFIEHKPTGRIITHSELKNEYQPIIYTGNTLLLNGYFQSYKYFEHCKQEIIDAFLFDYNDKEGKGIVSIHVRRGDYLELADFSVLSMYYYYQAITYFIEKGHTKFVVYSDDPTWCYKYINDQLYKGCMFYYGDGINPLWDMQQMSLCEHNIIANSSFSWWGAWLNQNHNKIVIAPDTWFKGVNKDLLPKEWIIIKNE